MTSDWVGDIEQLHLKFSEIGSHRSLRELVSGMSPEVLYQFFRFRVDFLREELRELEEAETAADAVDAIIDLCVVAIGTLDALGVDGREAWRRVHEANMAKSPGSNPSRPNRFGLPDLVKPEGWRSPVHDDVVGVLDKVFGRRDA